MTSPFLANLLSYRKTEPVMIVIIGGIGRVGQHVIRQLLSTSQPYQIRVLVHDTAKTSWLPGSVQTIVGDINNHDDLYRIMDDAERLLIIPPNLFNQAQLECEVYRTACRLGVNRVVKLSTTKADLNSPCHFFREHAIAEQFLKQSGLSFTILRANSFMQNLLWFTREIELKESLSLPVGQAITAPVDIRDVAAVAATVIQGNDHVGSTYCITGPEKLTFEDIAQKLSAVTGRSVRYRPITTMKFRKELVRLGMAAWFADAIGSAWDVARVTAPLVSDVVRNITGNEPITFDQFARTYFTRCTNNLL